MKLKRNLHLLRVSQHTLSVHAKKCLYYAQIYSHMTYGLTVWENMIPNASLIKLQKIQNKCFKLIFGKESTKDNFHFSKILRVSDMVKLANLKLGHKVQYSHLPARILSSCNTENKESNLLKQHRYPTKNKGIPNLPRTDCVHYRQSFLYQSTLIYQKLPLLVKSISNEKHFVSKCKDLIYNNAI